ncbi:hypothetical protein [Empedobacter stercoris]|uniref:hypothetical protein n=1 Tax=Empedobacter stercoris TaxID=1628248 RepID=UPI001CE03BB8|nr:hypothetical protein [Empedobacter stercoris]MCA4777431.1 hypothetical protein [Empedobacter stercoris]
MKKIFISILTATTLLLCSCTKNEEQKKLEIQVAELQKKINNIEKEKDSINPPKEEIDEEKISTETSEIKETITKNNLFKINNKINDINESCYHDPCSVSKTLSVEKVRENSEEVTLNVKILGGSKNWDSNKVDWNNQSHKITVVCSKTRPRISIGDQTDILPLNNQMGVPGVLVSSAELYFNYCHSTKDMAIEAAINKFNYNVSE